MPVVYVVLACLMMRSRGAIRLGMRIACRRTAIGFGGYSLWTPDSRECVCSVRIQCVRLHDRAIGRRGSPGSDKLESVCIGSQTSPCPSADCRDMPRPLAFITLTIRAVVEGKRT